jgi:hypothetical protein
MSKHRIEADDPGVFVYCGGLNARYQARWTVLICQSLVLPRVKPGFLDPRIFGLAACVEVARKAISNRRREKDVPLK